MGTALSLSSDLKYLRHNDIVEVGIEKIGKITNRVRVINYTRCCIDIKSRT